MTSKPNTVGLGEYTDDDLITELENRGRINKYHTAEIRLGDFSMKHTLRCHPDLFDCSIHRWLQDQFMTNRGLSPFEDGTYTLKEIKGNVKMTRVKG